MKKILFLAFSCIALHMSSGGTDLQARDADSMQGGNRIVLAKNDGGERSKPYLNVMQVSFEDVDSPESRISLGIGHKDDPRVISRYAETKSQKGAYSRSQFNVLVCEAGPCEQVWTAAFIYTDEAGKQDAFGLTWKQTVFDGITPTGTSKRGLQCCMNGECRTLEIAGDPGGRCTQLTHDNHCKSLESAADDDKPQIATLGRYQILWSRSSLVIRRADIMQKIVNSGGTIE